MAEPRVTTARMKHASASELATGLIGYAVLTIGNLEIYATVRRSIGGAIYIAFPARHVDGKRLSLVRPINQAARDAIERDALRLLGFETGRRA